MFEPEAFFMILASLPSLYGRVGAALSSLIIVFCCIGLTMHKDVYAGKPRPDFYCYYTNLSNLLVLLYFSLISPLLYLSPSLHRFIPTAEYCIAMVIALTHLVFHFLLFPAIRPQLKCAVWSFELRILAADNLIIHYIVPWLVLLYWLFCAPGKRQLSYSASVLWTLLPVAYLCFILFRGIKRTNLHETDSPYPYPFLDVAQWGAKCVALNCMRLYALSMAYSGGVLLLFKALFFLFGEDHALILI